MSTGEPQMWEKIIEDEKFTVWRTDGSKSVNLKTSFISAFLKLPALTGPVRGQAVLIETAEI